MLPNKRYPTSSKLMHQMYRKYVPNIMDDSLSLYEQMIAVIEHINNLVRTSDSLSDEITKDMNELITEVNDIRDFSLPENVIKVLKDWHESGYLNIIINENLQTQMDDYRTIIDNKLFSVDQQLQQTEYIDLGKVIPLSVRNKVAYPLHFNGSEINMTIPLASIKANPDKTFYINGSNGSDNDLYGDGTKEKPFKSLNKAWTTLNENVWTKATFFIAGYFRKTDQQAAATIPNGKTLSIIGDGTALLYAGDPATVKTWTQSGVVFSTNFTNGQNIIDETYPKDAYGLPKPLRNVPTLSECEATPHSYYTDGSFIHVHTHNGREPDASVFLLQYNGGLSYVLGDKATLYLENFKRYGVIDPSGVNGKGRVVLNNLTVLGSGRTTQGDTLAIKDVKETFVVDSVFAYSRKDGLNYHYVNTSESDRKNCYAYEHGVLSYGHGTDAGDQASTMHEGVTIIRSNGTYISETGSGIVDVGDPISINVNIYTEAKGTGMGINVDGVGSWLTLVNSTAISGIPEQYSVRAYNGYMKHVTGIGIINFPQNS